MPDDESRKRHRWVALITVAMTDDEVQRAGGAEELVIGPERPHHVSPALCFDCHQPASKADPECGSRPRPGYPVTP